MSTVATTPNAARLSSARNGVLEISPALAVACALLLLAIFTAVFWHFLYTQVRIGIVTPHDWGHTLVIPFISGWFVWMNREELCREPFRPAWTGLIFIVGGMLWYSMALLGPTAWQHHNIQGAGVALTLAGVVLLIFGWRSAKYLWFPVAYLVIFGQAVSDRFIQPVTLRLQDLAAQGAYVLLNAMQFDTDISGNVLTVFGSQGEPHPLNVAEACSGMRMLVAFLALGTAMAYAGLDRWWQRTLLVLMAVPVALAVNIVRVATLGVLSLRDMNMVQGEFHHFVGMVWLVPGFIMFLGIQWLLSIMGGSETPPKAVPRAR